MEVDDGHGSSEGAGGEGTSLPSSSGRQASTADPVVLASWAAWMQTAEGHFVEGRFTSCEEVSLPSKHIAAVLCS